MGSVTALKTLGERTVRDTARLRSLIHSKLIGLSKCRGTSLSIAPHSVVKHIALLLLLTVHSHNLVSAIKSGPLSAYGRFTGAGPMVDSFIFQIDWIIVSAMIGLLVALIGAFLYPRRDHD